MPSFSAVYTYGSVPASGSLVDESNLLVQSINRRATRTKKTYPNADGNTAGLRYHDPILTFEVEAWISSYAGLANQHPGTSVSSLTNHTNSPFGFSSSDGTLIYEDPTQTLSNEDMDKITFNVVQYPYVT